ncbi:MAG: hypothetical protein RLZZ124_687 [Cyanobacteriota bacterium]
MSGEVRRLRRLQGPPRKRTLLGLSGLALLLSSARPAVLVAYAGVAMGRALLEGRWGKRGG